MQEITLGSFMISKVKHTQFLVRRKRISSIAAMSVDGTVTYELTDRTVNGERLSQR